MTTVMTMRPVLPRSALGVRLIRINRSRTSSAGLGVSCSAGNAGDPSQRAVGSERSEDLTLEPFQPLA